ncbi:MAG: CDP-alcohol phosphatidyltransferase family protein [Alphaproteobacteria bacterium]
MAVKPASPMADRTAEPLEPDADGARLVLDGRKASTGDIDVGRVILGLPLLRRTALAAARSGFSEIIVLADTDDAQRFRGLLRGVPGATIEQSGAARSGANRRTVYVPARILGQREWLEPLARRRIDDRVSMSDPCGIVLAGRAVAPDLLPGCSGVERAAESLGLAPPPPVLATDRDVAEAERRLLRSLRKDTDGFMARLVERPLSLAITRRLAGTALSPNWMTVISVLVGLMGAPFFLSAAPIWQTLGALLFLAHSILDGCDGELARLKFLESRWGGVLDFWGDNVVHVAVFLCMGIGWGLAEGAGWPILLGAVAAGATLASAGFVYFHVMRRKDDRGPLYTSVSRDEEAPLSRLLDSLSRRDFIYLVVLLSFFGKASWFLAASAVGTPVFFALLVVAAARARSGSERG